MKIKYLGTAAAEGLPAVFCNCGLCRKARELGGKDIRTRSQAIINEDLLIDLPPDTYYHYLKEGFPLPDIKNLLVTHCHTDHFYATELEMRCVPLAYPQPEVMNIYGNETVREMFYQRMPKTFHVTDNYCFTDAVPFVPLEVDAYRVTPLTALHDRNQLCLIYLIQDGLKTVLYAHDTGIFPKETWEYLEEKRIHLDLVSLDCTAMLHKDGENHMGVEDNRIVKERLMVCGLADTDTVFVLNHFSHNGGWTHEELEEHTKKDGFVIAYDGLELEI